MRRMLDPTKVGGLPSTIEFDKDGNRKVKKNLGVDGKLTLTSLVSDSNPDGDITKELGGGGGDGTLYCHCINFERPATSENKGGRLMFNYFCKKQDAFTYETFKALFTTDTEIACSGIVIDLNNVSVNNGIFNAFYIELQPRGTHEDLFVVHITKYKTYESAPIYNWVFQDNVSEVI